MLLKFKYLYEFQKNNWSIDNVKVGWNLEEYKPDDTDKFHSFRYIHLDDSNDFTDKHYFFPLFVRTRDADEQFIQYAEFIKNNPSMFESKKLIPVVLDVLEGIPHTTFQIERLANEVKHITELYVITGNKLLLNSKNFVFYYTNHWVHRVQSKLFSMTQLEPEHKIFLNTNRVAREHRIMLLAKILERLLRNKGYISWAGLEFIPGTLEKPEFKVIKEHTFDILDVENIIEANPTRFIPVEYCKKSFLWLVTETHYENTSMFFSEKIYKPMNVGMPFIALGNPGTLFELKNLGFKTFNKWIDESYDEDLPTSDRCNKVVDELVRFSKMTNMERLHIREQMKGVLEHNYNHLKKLQQNSDFIEALIDIKNRVTS